MDTVVEEIVAEMEANGDLEKFETGVDFLEALRNAREEKKNQYAPSKPVPSGPAGALVFNPTGDLLAVGTIASWQIWDVEQQELLVEHEAEGVYALTFSPDGRWFAWGDTGGIIHLWAVLR